MRAGSQIHQAPKSTGPMEHWGPPTRGKQPPVQWGLFLNSALRLSWAQQGWATRPHLHLSLDPGPHDVGLAGELAAEVLVGLLLALLLQEGVVPLGHQLLHLGKGTRAGAVRGRPPRLAGPAPALPVGGCHPPSPTWS